ncbi:ComEC/Rec2 family competence protein [Actinomycetes bacterium KLBMP 9797]
MPPDLRLAGLALAAWLSALTALHTSAETAFALAGGAALLAVAGTVAMRRRPLPHGWVLIGFLLGVVCGGAAAGARVSTRDAGPLAALVRTQARVEADLVVRDDPRRVGTHRAGPPTYAVSVDLHAARPTEGRALRMSARLLVLASDDAWRQLLPGQRLAASGRLMPASGGDLRAGVLSTNSPPRLRGVPSWPQRAAGGLRAGLQRACAPLPDGPGGLLPGLVVGDVSRLDPAVADDFRATGMTHLVAVSGSNVAIVVGAVLLVTRWARAGPWLAAGVCGVALLGFVILARPSPSVVRAATMGAIGLAALASGRPRAALPALGAAVTALVVIDPELAGDAGFALSVLATGGLLLLAPRWRDALRRRGVPAGVAEAAAIPAAAQLACAPVVAGLSGTVSLVAIPANLLAVPAIAPATLLGVAAALASPVWPAAAEFAAWLAGWPAWWLVLVARHGARAPAGSLPWPDGVGGALLLAVLSVAFLIAARRRLVRRLAVVVAVAVAIGALPVRLVAAGWPPAGLSVAVCAVGQGDAVVVPVGPGAAVVVDAGPDPPAIDRCLRRLGVRAVPLLLITHFHLDHVGGVEGVLRGRTLGAVVTTAWPEPAFGRELVLRSAAARRVPVLPVHAGWARIVGSVEIRAIGPPYPLRGTRSDPNNNSLMLSVRGGGVHTLLAGDAEVEEQRALLDQVGAAQLRADVLKIAHHGSAYQDPEFLDAVDPAVALVSVGADNRYGHPAPAVLARLVRGGARVLRTDVDGDLAAVRTGRGLAVAHDHPPP